MEQAGHGVIINMTWDLAIHGFQGRNPQMFAAVKAGVRGFSQSLAKSVAPDVRVNLLAPGWIETAFAEELMKTTYYQERISEIPLSRFGKPEDVANAALYLASDEASYITGQIININGGLV
jgi:3-oxoacyl-[acyl-carrier protein] reductase